ncbi:putative transcriptional regulator YvhJ [Moorella thermoacetica]|uniref:Putative transcriptional regulator YvhJ n=1 Tax=Neomoorella thermoacetica TaxID=1525 RepID=A0A1J5NPP6_NEOTH|nr:putative transcriptional regulator YvhJ [Moorella thermoacetica]
MLRGKLKLIIAFLLACLAAGGGFLAARLFLVPPVPGQETGSTDTGGSKPGTLNILLLGTDARPGQKVGNTDTIILAHFDGERLALLSIPRDTRVNIPGHGMDKINTAYGIGGPDLITSIVADLTGVPISKYALLRWDGFIKIIDLVGGVTVNIPRNMYYYDPVDGPQYKINLKKGLQHLDGHQALAFVRFREEALGDIDRTGQQQELIKALLEKVRQPGTLLKMPRLLPEIYKNVETNMGLDEMLTMARAGLHLKNMTVVSQTLPGYFQTINGISYWGVDPAQARQVAQALFEYGQTTKQVVLDAPASQASSNSKGTTPASKADTRGTSTSTRVTSPRPPAVKDVIVTTPAPEKRSNRTPVNNPSPQKPGTETTTGNGREQPASGTKNSNTANHGSTSGSTPGNGPGSTDKSG